MEEKVDLEEAHKALAAADVLLMEEEATDLEEEAVK